MRIAFICGSLEKGSDGVGDYTLRLATRLSFLGADCCCISINDSLGCSEIVGASPPGNHDAVMCFRLSSLSPWKERRVLLHRLLRSWQPDWISLQYVPYSFDIKGLPFSLQRCLRDVKSLASWHIMTHELWVDPEARIKNWFLAIVQKRLLGSLFSYLRPKVIHTSNQYYCRQLNAIGYSAEILPLFGNVEIQQRLPNVRKDHNVWSFVFFGTIHREWNPRDLLKSAELAARQQGITSIEFLSIGLAGAYGHELWYELASNSLSWITFKQLGVLSSIEISQHLNQSDFGVTTTPSHLTGKSGSVAAMLAHGLPVIVPRLEKTHGLWHSSLKADRRFILLDSDFSHAMSSTRKFSPQDQLPATAEQFLQSLMSAA